MGVRPGDHPRGTTTGGAPARAARRWRPATLVAVAAVAILLASGAGRDSHPPQESEIAARPGVEQVEPRGGKLYPPRYDTLDYELNQLVARHEGRDAAPGTPATVAGRVINVVVRLDPAYVHEVAAYLREQGAGVAERGAGAEYLSAAVPLSALADLAGRPGVHLVMAEPPIQRFDGGIAPHGADFWQDPGWDGGNANDSDPNNDFGNVRIGILDTGFVGYGNGLTAGRVPDPEGVHCFLDSASSTTDTIAACELALATRGNTDEHGTWVTQLAYDIAPGADYYLARIEIPSQFDDAITWLIGQQVDVISTSLGNGWEGPGDGTSPYSDAWLRQVARAVDAGIFVAVASGNSDTSSWFGTFSDSDSDNVMEWNESADECNEVQLVSGAPVNIRVRWEDSWNGANDDLDIYLREKPPATDDPVSGSNVAMSEGVQSGLAGHDPVENILLTDGMPGTYCLVVEREPGVTPDWVQVIIEAAGDSVRSMEHWASGYSLTSPGETTKAGAVTVGAAPANNTTTIQSTSGRGPMPASSASTVVKPDVVGVDRVAVVTAQGTRTLEGTSLATPHVAGLAALVKQRNAGYTPAQIATYLKDNALPRGEPVPNNTWGHGLAFLPHIGPVITGKPQIGVTLTADTIAVDDIDTLPTYPNFTYQWIRVSSGGTEANISDATSATYTPVQADVGKTLKVQVSFRDVAIDPNDEEQTSRASLRVVPANRAATGKPTISGTLRVTETVTASTSPIRDADGVTGVTFEYQWVRVDGGTDTDISGATASSYVLDIADEGKTVRVKVSFADNNRNAETVVSDASAVVGSAPNRPAQFSAATASREVEENTPAGQDIGTAISATDLDNDPLTYAIRNDSELFAIVASTGQLRTKGSLDYETMTSHTIVVQVTDNKDIDGVADMVIDDEIQVTITIEDVNEPAIISGPRTPDWLENTAGTIATYTARDPDLGDQVFLTLIAGRDSDSFDFSNGRLSFKSEALPDFERRSSHQIELGADDDDDPGTPYDTTSVVTINIRDVDEPPVISFSAHANVARDGNALSLNEDYRDRIAAFRASDPERAPGLTYQWSVVGTDAGDFAVTTATDTRSAQLSFAASLDYDRPADSNSDNTYSITVQATDIPMEATENGTPRPLTSRIALTVTVTLVPTTARPIIRGDAQPSIEEGGATLVGTYTATGRRRDDFIVWQPLEGNLDGNDADQFTFTSTGSNGRLALRATPNYESPTDFQGDNSYNVTLAARVGNDTVRRAVVVKITNKDEAGEIRISSLQPVVNVDLTATLSDIDRVDSAVWTWESATSRSGPWTALTGASDTDTESTYTPRRPIPTTICGSPPPIPTGMGWARR